MRVLRRISAVCILASQITGLSHSRQVLRPDPQGQTHQSIFNASFRVALIGVTVSVPVHVKGLCDTVIRTDLIDPERDTEPVFLQSRSAYHVAPPMEPLCRKQIRLHGISIGKAGVEIQQPNRRLGSENMARRQNANQSA